MLSLVTQQNNSKQLSAKIQSGKITANSMINSGSVCSIITKTLTNKILQSNQSAQWITSKCGKDLKTISTEPIKVFGKIVTTIVYSDWICEEALLPVVEDGHKLMIGR